jgi:hypothetical protein
MVRLSQAAIALTLAVAPSVAAAQPTVYAYPAKGQSEEQQTKDRQACQDWAARQSGYDPAAPAPAPEASRGGVLRGAGGGAAVGAIGGAIGGDAGKGAAIGAATGGIVGGVRQNRQNQAAGQQQQARLADYNSALATCFRGRGYTVN